MCRLLSIYGLCHFVTPRQYLKLHSPILLMYYLLSSYVFSWTILSLFVLIYFLVPYFLVLSSLIKCFRESMFVPIIWWMYMYIFFDCKEVKKSCSLNLELKETKIDMDDEVVIFISLHMVLFKLQLLIDIDCICKVLKNS